VNKLKVGSQQVNFGSSKHMSELATGSVQLFVTSPPYWNLKDYGDAPDAIGHTDYEAYLDDLNDVWSECYRAASDDAVLIINVNSRRNKGRLYPIAFDIVSRMKGWVLWDVNIWYIPNALPQPNHYMERLLDNKFEYILVFTKNASTQYKFSKPRVPQKYAVADPRAHKRNAAGRCLGNILRVPAYRPPNVRKGNYHIAAFPEELVSFFVHSSTNPGDRVVDPFVGSGTTLKVCEVMGRNGIGYEVETKFADLIKARIEEPWSVPDWRDLDIIHSARSDTGTAKRRRPKISEAGDDLFVDQPKKGSPGDD
jgi:DNA modification methylase